MGAGLRPQHLRTIVTPRKSPTGENFPSSMPGQRMLRDTTNPQVLITASWQLCYLTGRSRSPSSVLRTIHRGFRRTRQGPGWRLPPLPQPCSGEQISRSPPQLFPTSAPAKGEALIYKLQIMSPTIHPNVSLTSH